MWMEIMIQHFLHYLAIPLGHHSQSNFILINAIQLHREKSKALKHQYVVLILSDDCTLRLDQRGDEVHPMDTVTNTGIESIDTIEDVNSLSELDKTSYCLAKLYCQDSDVDLSDIIKICVAIHRDRARCYMLRRFNCYLFSWTILAMTVRHAMPWDMLPFNSPWKLFSQTWADQLLMKFAEVLINMMVNGSV